MANEQSFAERFHATNDTTIDAAYWNSFVLELAARFTGLEGIKISWEEVSRQGIDVALARINEVLGPTAERIRDLAALGFLIASSETPATLGNGAVLNLVVTAGVSRGLFTPSPFVMLTRSLSPADYGVAKLRTYDRETGELQIEVVSFVGDPGPHSDWSIGAIAGSTLAQLLLLNQGQAAQAAAEAALAAVTPQRDEVAAKWAEVLAKHAEALPARDQAVRAAAGFMPWDFTADGLFWTAAANGSPTVVATFASAGSSFQTVAGLGRVLRSNVTGAVLPRGVLAPIPGRRYRVEVRARVTLNKTAGANGAGVEWWALDANYATPVKALAPDVQVVENRLAYRAAFATGDGVATFAVDYLAPDAPPPFLRPRFFWNDAGGNATVEVLSFLAYDVTAAYDAGAFADQLNPDAKVDKAAAQLTGTLTLTGTVTPAQIAADVNDYAPAGAAAATRLRLSSDQAGRLFTGLAGGADGRLVLLQNVGAFPLRLVDQAAASIAANRLALGGDYELAAGASVALDYDASVSRWRPVGPLHPSSSRNFAIAAAITF